MQNIHNICVCVCIYRISNLIVVFLYLIVFIFGGGECEVGIIQKKENGFVEWLNLERNDS